MKWCCQASGLALKGRPFFIEGDKDDTWEIDLSDMYCPTHEDKDECIDWLEEAS